jgi:hypothetical protein
VSRDVKTIREGNARRVLTLLDGLAKSEDEKDQENSKPSIQNLVQFSKKVWAKTLAIANVF